MAKVIMLSLRNITKKEKIREMRNYMSICETGYYNKVTSVCGEKTHIKRLNHSFETAHNFLLEGANMVLMRYFALIRHKGVVQTDTVLIAGEICESVYVRLLFINNPLDNLGNTNSILEKRTKTKD